MRPRWARQTWLVLSAVICLAACGSGVAGGRSYSDPFAYCAAVGTADAPGADYTGPAMPRSVSEGLRRALGAPPDTPSEVFTHGASWRCMNGRVYACIVGANLPCGEKADTSRTPSPAVSQFCREQPGANVVPAYVTGRATVYEWRCRGAAPVIVRQVAEPDARGFIANIWYEIPPAQ